MMSTSIEQQGPLPNGALIAFAATLASHGIAVDVARLRHALGHDAPAAAADILRIAHHEPGIRARRIVIGWDRLARTPLPALANGPSGWFVIGARAGDQLLVQFPGQAPQRLDRAGLEAVWSGELVLVAVRDGDGLIAGRFDVRWFIPQIVRYRRLIGEVLAITLAINLLGLAAPLFFQNIVDKVLVHHTRATLQVLAIGFLVVSLWEVAFGWLRTRLFSETTQKIDVELGARLFRHLLRLPLAYFESRRVGDTVTRVRQLETIREFLTNASLTVLIDPLFTVLFLIAMAIYSPLLFGIVALTLPAYALISIVYGRPMRRLTADKYERGAASNALLVETVSGIETVKAAAVEPQWQQRWERQLAAYCAASQRVINLGNSGTQAVQLVSKLSFAAILYFGAGQVMAGALTVGGLVAFNMFAQRVSGPVIRMAQLWQEFQQVRLSVERLGDILNQPVEQAAASRAALPAIKGAIRFEQVRFRYGIDGPVAVEHVDLDLPAGTSVGIVGSSGSGKSTLAKLLQRLYVPQRGRITIDDVDLARVDPAWLRRQIGVVLQENLLFNRTIRENIALANPTMPLDQVIAAAQLAGAHDFILKMPMGYDTPVEERGVNFSGGQRQRIAIARALVTNPRILIFDEATSALDAESERIIQGNLDRMAKGRTLIVIAHRLSAVRGCDRIVVMEDGRIIETGDHGMLLALGGRYAALHTLQMGEAA